MSQSLNEALNRALGFHTASFANNVTRASNFPPYNIIVDSASDPTAYTIEMAVAGYSKDDINVRVRKDDGVSTLVIKGEIKKAEDEVAPKIYQVRGLSSRDFTREFTIGNNVKVETVALKDGILTITLSVTKIPDDEFEITT